MSDYFNMKTDKYLSDIVGPRWYISGGALVWIMLGLLMITMTTSKTKAQFKQGSEQELTARPDGICPVSIGMPVLTFLPGIALWLTYMLATPLSFSFRYLFGLLLCIPLFLCPIFNLKSGDA